jgi:hypothetical protein
VQRLQAGRWADAVAALERAQALTSGFVEVHQYLAIAYWRDGRLHQARDQLAMLGTLDRDGSNVAALSRKLQRFADVARPQ